MKKQNVYLRISIVVLFIFFMILTTSTTSYGATKSIYVDGINGMAVNDGLSLTTAKKTVQQAVDLAMPGDTIYIRAGTYYENIIVIRSGSEGSPITLTSYNYEKVTIDGGGEVTLRTRGQISYWNIDGLTLRSTNRYTIRLGWWGEPTTSHWNVRNNKIFGANFLMGSYHVWENNDIDGVGYNQSLGDAGISDAGDSHHNIYRNNVVHDFTHHDARGIWTQGFTHDTLIENNIVYNIVAKTGLGQCIDLDGAAKVEWRHVVRGNTINNCSYVGIQLENSFDTLVEKNTIIEGGYAGIIIINYDARVGCPAGGELGQYGDTNGDNSCRGDDTDNIIRQNLIANAITFRAGYGGIMNWYAGGVDIWGNTIYSGFGSNNGGINIQGTFLETKDTTIINNIIQSGTGVSICAQDFRSISQANNNVVYRDNGATPFASGVSCSVVNTLNQFQIETGSGFAIFMVNPYFSNVDSMDFNLLPNSPAINTGVYVGSDTDINNIILPNGAGYDIGAFEFQGQTAVTPTQSPTLVKTPLPTKTTEPTVIVTPGENNLALNKFASQINTLNDEVASRAVDGSVDGSFTSASISSTLYNDHSWWEVDLGSSYHVDKVVLWNRNDSGDWKLTDFYIIISDKPFISKDLHTTLNQEGVSFYFEDSQAGRPSEFSFNMKGRYIRIQLLNRDMLSIAELQVVGTVDNYILRNFRLWLPPWLLQNYRPWHQIE